MRRIQSAREINCITALIPLNHTFMLLSASDANQRMALYCARGSISRIRQAKTHRIDPERLVATNSRQATRTTIPQNSTETQRIKCLRELRCIPLRAVQGALLELWWAPCAVDACAQLVQHDGGNATSLTLSPCLLETLYYLGP